MVFFAGRQVWVPAWWLGQAASRRVRPTAVRRRLLQHQLRHQRKSRARLQLIFTHSFCCLCIRSAPAVTFFFLVQALHQDAIDTKLWGELDSASSSDEFEDEKEEDEEEGESDGGNAGGEQDLSGLETPITTGYVCFICRGHLPDWLRFFESRLL